MIRRMNMRLVNTVDFCIAYRKAAEKNQSMVELSQTLKMTPNAIASRRHYLTNRKGLTFPKLRENRGRRMLTARDVRTLQAILNGRR